MSNGWTVFDASGQIVYKIVPYTHGPEPERAMLSVPWVSQLGPSADFAPGDCGPACTAMWLHYYGLTHLTVNDCSAKTGLAPGYNYTMPAHLMNIMRAYGYETYWRHQLELSDLQLEIDAGDPCIVLVEYDELPVAVRYDKRYQYGHWLLIVGYTPTHIVYHDPYFPSTAGGAFIEITDAQLDHAWGSNSQSGNRNFQAIRVRR